MGRGIVRGQRVARRKLQRAKELRRGMTDAERILWQAVRRNKLGGFHFRRQQVVGGFIVDFYCDRPGLVVEVDGPIHRLYEEYDDWRDGILEARGLCVVRIANELVQTELQRVLDRILALCHSLARPPFPAGEGGQGAGP